LKVYIDLIQYVLPKYQSVNMEFESEMQPLILEVSKEQKEMLEALMKEVE
jgi:hypothetical protein